MRRSKVSFFEIIVTLLIILSLDFVLPQTVPNKAQVTGVVFKDKNRNGTLDLGEPGIPEVVVSNQLDAVQTDQKGRYVLDIDESTIVFISKPAGYRAPLSKDNLPQFYYIHQPKGSPLDLIYPGIEPSGELPESIDFPLIKSEVKTNFLAIITGDPQMRDEQELDYFRHDIISQMKGTPAEFYLALGDIAYDDLNIYPSYNQTVAELGMPVYNVAGNHDMNLVAFSDSL
ncbi:metallophosphoesterase, partial [bacterium]|nr:metallophosphoesterase [bacterium]